MSVEGEFAAHIAHAATAKQLYLASMTPGESAQDWAVAVAQARELIGAALVASASLTDIAKALAASGQHMRVYRALTAPPISQDQFSLACQGYWKKASEKKGRLKPQTATKVAQVFDKWRDRNLTPWIEGGREPANAEKVRLLNSVAPLIAVQEVATVRRNRQAAEQEKAVLDLLDAANWKKLPSSLLDTRAALPAKHYMYKTRFATNTAAPQEVDVACGLRKSYVLALECKVTNDATNSVKRVNDVLKKAAAWKAHWGSFVEPAALLQGVIQPKDVKRLLDAGVIVFWSHDLGTFSEWLNTRV